MNTSIYLTLLDEIALEGLRGITFCDLWVRLRERDKFLLENGYSQLFHLNPKILHDLVFKILLKEIKRGIILSFSIYI